MVIASASGASTTVGQVIRWWELRRLAYNAVLLVVGLATIAGYEWLMSKLIPLGEDAIEPMGLVVLVVLYGAMANLFYTLGWIIELRGRKTDPVVARQRGQQMFRAGLLCSSVLAPRRNAIGLQNGSDSLP